MFVRCPKCMIANSIEKGMKDGVYKNTCVNCAKEFKYEVYSKLSPNPNACVKRVRTIYE